MKMEMNDFLELVRKAAMYDAVINYIKNTKYVDRKDVLTFAGEKTPVRRLPHKEQSKISHI